jgi:excisionase family DNA binding protein
MSAADDRLLTIREVADLIGLAPGTCYHLVSQGRIPVLHLSRRCIRFRLSDIHRWLEELSTHGRSESIHRKAATIEKNRG